MMPSMLPRFNKRSTISQHR